MNTPIEKKPFDDLWYWYLTGLTREGKPIRLPPSMLIFRGLFGVLPGRPRCIECNVPLSGLGTVVAKPLGFGISSFSSRLCNNCEKTARKEQAGAEVELSMLFADVRGSTTLAETVSTLEFQKLIQRFYQAASEVLVAHNAMVNRLMGDQVIGLFVPRFAGSGHAKVAIHAAQQLMRLTGHEDVQGPWIPVGAGVHTGMAYVGAVGSKEGVNEIAVLGSAANLAARLSSQAADGEVIISQVAAESAGLEAEGMESRNVELKGISQPVPVRVMQVRPGKE